MINKNKEYPGNITFTGQVGFKKLNPVLGEYVYLETSPVFIH